MKKKKRADDKTSAEVAEKVTRIEMTHTHINAQFADGKKVESAKAEIIELKPRSQATWCDKAHFFGIYALSTRAIAHIGKVRHNNNNNKRNQVHRHHVLGINDSSASLEVTIRKKFNIHRLWHILLQQVMVPFWGNRSSELNGVLCPEVL